MLYNFCYLRKEIVHLFGLFLFYIRKYLYKKYFEDVANDMINILTEEKRRTILKYETPDNIKIIGIEYAVLKDNIKTFDEFN